MSRTLTSFRPSAAIAAVIAAGAVLASCSSGSDDQSSSPAPTSPSEPTAESEPTSPSEPTTESEPTAESYPAGSPEAGITATAEEYLAAVSSGKFDAVVAVSCQKIVDTIPEGEEAVDSPPLPQPIVLDNIENFAIDGDSATADVTASVEGAAEIPAETETLVFVNEDGWKICE